MNISYYQIQISSIEKDIADFHKKIADESKKEIDKSKWIFRSKLTPPRTLKIQVFS